MFLTVGDPHLEVSNFGGVGVCSAVYRTLLKYTHTFGMICEVDMLALPTYLTLPPWETKIGC